MVTSSLASWVTFTTGTAANVLYGTQLNANFSYLETLLKKGITGANIATGGIDAGALIAANIVTHANLNFNTSGGCRVVQIGKASNTTACQLALKGVATAAINTTATNTDVTILYSSADVWGAADVYKAGHTPHVYVTCIYATPTEAPLLTLKSVTSGGAVVNVARTHTTDAYITEAITVRWMAMGDI